MGIPFRRLIGYDFISKDSSNGLCQDPNGKNRFAVFLVASSSFSIITAAAYRSRAPPRRALHRGHHRGLGSRLAGDLRLGRRTPRKPYSRLFRGSGFREGRPRGGATGDSDAALRDSGAAARGSYCIFKDFFYLRLSRGMSSVAASPRISIWRTTASCTTGVSMKSECDRWYHRYAEGRLSPSSPQP